MKTILFYLIALVIIPTRLFSQVYFDDLNRNFNESKFDNKIYDFPEIARYYPFSDGHGLHPDLSKLPSFPKKIALVSFNVWDNSLVLLNKSPEHFWTDKNWIHDDENFVAFAMHHYGIDNIKYVFDSVGITVITPEEFDVNQQAIYNSFTINYSKNFRRNVSDSIQFDLCAAPGYKFIKNPVDETDESACEDLGLLAVALGVDAVLIIENDVISDARHGVLKKVKFSLYGENPNYNLGIEKPNYKGLHYLTTTAMVNAKFFEHYKDDKIFESYACYDKIIHSITKHMLVEFEVRKSIKSKTY